MYGAGIQAICEQEVFTSRGCHGHLDSAVWRKREKCKKARVRWPGVNTPVLETRCIVQDGGTPFREKNVQVLANFTAKASPTTSEAAKSGSRKATGSEASEVSSVPWTDAKGLLDELPLKVSVGLILENLGALHEGPNEDKYWSQNRCGLQHPYPVGYTATKTYKGIQFHQTIEEGPHGPIYVVGEVNKTSCSADSPTKAWSLALASSSLSITASRVHGRKHFGFDCPMVLGLLSQMGKEHVVKKGLAEGQIFDVRSEEARISREEDIEQKIHRYRKGLKGLPGDCDLEASKANDGPQIDMGESMSSAEQFKPLAWEIASTAGPFERSIRLRSVRVDDTLHQKVQILSCQDTSHPITRGFLQEAVSSLSNEDSTITAFSNKEFLTSDNKISKSNTSFQNGSVSKTSIDSILRRMDEVARSGGQQSTSGNSSWKHDSSENSMNGRNAEQEVLQQNSPTSRLFSSPIHRSKILSEESVPKDNRRTAQTRSLANLLEQWNSGGRPQIVLNGKPQVQQERRNQPLRRPTKLQGIPLAREEKDECVSSTRQQSSLPDGTDAAIERRVAEWGSGKKGQSSVLKEIQELVANRCVDQALQILRRLHATGFDLDDSVYSMLFPFVFDDWQKQAIAHLQEKPVLLSGSGGAGRFAVAARCLYQAFVQGERSLIVTPYEALARDHCRQLQISFGSKNVTCVLSKEEDQRSQFPLTVMTLETLVKELREGRFTEGSTIGNSFCEGMRLVVMERFHTMGDATYGSLWEEVVMLLDHKVKVLALSLPTNASNDIVSWISSIHRPCELVLCESQPVPKSQYYCDDSGLRLLEGNDELSSSNYHNFLSVEGVSAKDFQQRMRVLVQSVQTEAFLPLAISFSSIDDCIKGMHVANEVITDVYISAEEVACFKERLQNFLHENANVEGFINKDDIKCLSRGFCLFHEGQLPSWAEFVEGLVRDNLVKIVFVPNTTLSSMGISFRTIVLCFISEKSGPGNTAVCRSDFNELCGKAGRRGLDSNGNVVFVGNHHIWGTEGVVMESDSTLNTFSHFKPSYSLLLNLMSKHPLPEVRHLMDLNYGEYLAKQQLNKELKELEVQISNVKERKKGLEAQLFLKLRKVNTTKLQDATPLTLVELRVPKSGPDLIDDVLPGVLCAVLPGPSKLLYMILCADNIFRLLPAGALDHVYTNEKPLDALYRSSKGQPLQPPPLPTKEKWKPLPGDYLAYTSEGTAGSARVVEALLQYGLKFLKTEEMNCREDLRSCNGLLSTLYERQEAMLSSRSTMTWTKAEKLIEVLEKADAVELTSKDFAPATIKPLGVLISKFHHVENELWFTMALSSSIVKPLTAPELAAICSALLYRRGQTDSATSGHNLESLSKSNVVHDAPKRLRSAMEKLEELRENVRQLQGSDSPPLRLDGSVIAVVHFLCRESVGQEPLDDVDPCRGQMVPLVQQIIKLLHDIDNVWGRSLHVLAALEGTSGLHNLARRAAHLLKKAIGAVS